MHLLGSRVGRIRIVGALGQGGMGKVYAGYDEKLQRKVALKALRQEFRFDEETKGRFLREARTLSHLQHPNICQIHDLIETPEADFLVLELVEGETLARALRTPISERLKPAIAEQIAAVLVAAHGAGIVHRDLKPGNVMLTSNGIVKVLDFGLARSQDEEMASSTRDPSARCESGDSESGRVGHSREVEAADEPETLVSPSSARAHTETRQGVILGTPGYMSPEQARGEVATPASDMYCFGLVLQELFTGHRPYDPDVSAGERLQQVRDGRVRPVAGKMDRELLALIDRLTSLQPGARPSARDAAERLGWIRAKPYRRLRRRLIAAAFLSLIMVSVLVSYQARRIAREAERARREAETAEQVSSFLVDLFEVSGPEQARGNSITAREILDKGAARLRGELAGQPLVRARMMQTIGWVYLNLGLYDQARPLLEEALRIRRRQLGLDHLETATSLDYVGTLRRRLGDLEGAHELFRRALAIRERVLSPEHEAIADSHEHLGLLFEEQGDYARAREHYEHTLAVREKVLGDEHRDTADALNSLGTLLLAQGDAFGALPYFARALGIYERVLGPQHHYTAAALSNVGLVLMQQGSYEEAEVYLSRSLGVTIELLGREHAETARALVNLGVLQRSRGDARAARDRFQRALTILENALGSEHPDVGAVLHELANVEQDDGHYGAARNLYDRALAIYEEALNPSHYYRVELLKDYSAMLRTMGEDAEAEALLAGIPVARE